MKLTRSPASKKSSPETTDGYWEGPPPTDRPCVPAAEDACGSTCQSCHLRDGPRCVCNLIAVPGELAPISFGLRLGLGHFYEPDEVPPCVRGTLGAAYWSVKV